MRTLEFGRHETRGGGTAGGALPSESPQEAPAPIGARRRARVIAGVLLVVAGFVIMMGIITAEAEYPGIYTTHDNEVSDLGATRPPDSIIRQPSARIFNGTMLLSGALILSSAFLLHKGVGVRRVTITVGIMGLGVLGVGVFPGNRAPMHGLFAMAAFVSGGLAGIMTMTVQRGAGRYVSGALGAIALGALVAGILGEATPLWDELGDGGVERWIVYPVVLWIVMFGAYVLGAAEGMGERVTKPLRNSGATGR